MQRLFLIARSMVRAGTPGVAHDWEGTWASLKG